MPSRNRGLGRGILSPAIHRKQDSRDEQYQFHPARGTTLPCNFAQFSIGSAGKCIQEVRADQVAHRGGGVGHGEQVVQRHAQVVRQVRPAIADRVRHNGVSLALSNKSQSRAPQYPGACCRQIVCKLVTAERFSMHVRRVFALQTCCDPHAQQRSSNVRLRTMKAGRPGRCGSRSVHAASCGMR